MVLLVWPPPDNLWIGRKSRQFPPLSDRPTPAQASPLRSYIRPELRFPHAAAQTRIVSVARIRLDSRKSVRPFKGIFCDDISEFESHMPQGRRRRGRSLNNFCLFFWRFARRTNSSDNRASMTHLLGRRPLQLARLRASGSAP